MPEPAALTERSALAIAPGERVLLVGDSGSGKSTLLAALAGLLEGDEVDGDARSDYLAFEVVNEGPPGRAGLVLQDPASQLVMARIGDEVAFGCENLGVPPDEIPERVRAALVAVGLGGLPLDWPTERLSGGQAQRLAIACALAMRPRLLLLDEPTANLDDVGAAEVVSAVTALAAADPRLALVIAEHRVELWRGLATRGIVLSEGRIVIDGPASELERRDPIAALGSGPLVRPERRFPTYRGPQEGPNVGNRRPREQDRAAAGLVARATGLAVGRDGTVLQSGIDLEVRPGEAIAITGPNGAGKSTLALTIAGLIEPLAGTVTLAGRDDPFAWRSRELLPIVGSVFQSPERQFVARSVEEELSVGPKALGRPEAETAEVTGRLLDRLGLTRLAGASPFSLSGGEQRRLSVGTALATAPRLLVLDEPTFGQDPRTWAELVRLLREAMHAGTAVLVVTHDRQLVAALGARELRLAAPEPGQTGGNAGGAEAPGAAGSDRRPGAPGHRAAPPRSAPLATAGTALLLDPVARLGAAILLAAGLAASVDPLSAGVALVLELALTPLLRIGWRHYWIRTWPVWLASPLAGLTLLLYADPAGRHYFDAGLVHVTDGSLFAAATLALRVLALALPAVTLLIGVEATALADSLTQHLRLPQRFVYGALGAFRLIETFREDWRQLALSRRARGVADSGRIRRWAGSAFALLVVAIRRGTALATAMEARGFGGPGPRSRSRHARFGAREVVLLIVAAAVAAVGLGAAIAFGAYRPLLG